jgi:glutathionylspermidine synthase
MDKYQQFCVDEADFHLQRARELLTEGLKEPKKYYDEAQEFYKTMIKLIPFMFLIQQRDELPQPDLNESGSSPSSPSSVQSDEDSYVSESLPHH